MARALLIGPLQRQKIAEAVAFARARPTPMRELAAMAVQLPRGATMTLDKRPPGFKRWRSGARVVIPHGYEAAISFEIQPPGLCRHLSVSIVKRGKLPSPEAFWAIAAEFGIDRIAVVSGWVEEYEPGRFAQNVVALETPPAGHS